MNTTLVFNDMDQGWPLLLSYVMNNGREVRPRGLLTLECERVMFTLTDPSRAVVTDPRRKLNHAFSAVEFLWVISGQDEVETLAYFNSRMRDFADRPKVSGGVDDAPLVETPNAILFGAYGPPITQQLPYVVRNLRADPDSRQAVITIWRPSPPKTKDVPCTVMLQYLLRDGRLNAMTVMRSNDLWLGTPYDVPLFCRVQAYVASLLGVEVGEYTHVAGSLHAYSNNFKEIETAIAPRHVGLRPDELVVGKLDPSTAPVDAWYAVERAAQGIDSPSLVYGEGWNQLVRLAAEYAARKRAKETTSGA